ncbi:MAG: exo-alpha-sialidase [Lentisphaerae bacterium]|jgi:hypothetical protein|nr:exo-alpha-sialidase [Lentisphaerota bacterium]
MSKLEKLTRLVADGRHNAFTSMTRFAGTLYLTYRSSSGHGACDGQIILLRSRDNSETWENLQSPFQLDRNYYEGFLVEFKGRLFMFAGAYDADRPVREQLSSTWVSVSDDGCHWSENQLAGKTHWRFWHPLVIDDTMYVARYRLRTRANLQSDGTFPAEDWEVDLAASNDGLQWRKLSEISRNEAGNETELYWDGNYLTAFIRRENAPCTLGIRQSAPPFTHWDTCMDFGECVQGMRVKKCGGRLFMFGRRRESSPNIGTIYYDRRKISFRSYIFVPEYQRWFDYLQLPGAWDCSYPDMIELDEQRMLVSYYSQHPYQGANNMSSADIFLAVVRSDGEPEICLGK